MKYCPHCGAAMDDHAVVCTKCGSPVPPTNAPGSPDSPSIGIGVLCAFIPLVGLVLYLIWMDSKPLRAHSAGKGALVGVAVSVGLYLLSLLGAGCLMAGVLTRIISALSSSV